MLVLIVLLVIFGLAVLFSSSEYNGRVRFGDSACYFKKQLFATALGMGVMYMVSSIDYHFFLRLGPVEYLISMFLSGARLPLSTASPPVWLYGLSIGLITSGFKFTQSLMFSPTVLPVTVMHSV